MFRHGLRVSEACALQLNHVDTESRVMHIARLKNGLSTTHPIRGGKLRVIKAWLADRASSGTLAASPWPIRARTRG
jgi:type 1 fimbriae regulatory protein FimB